MDSFKNELNIKIILKLLGEKLNFKKNITFVASVIVFFAIVDRLLLFHILPKFRMAKSWWWIVLFFIGFFIIWYYVVFAYVGGYKVRKLDFLAYGENKENVKKVWLHALFPLIVLESAFWILLILPERDCYVWETGYNLFFYIGEHYLDSILTSRLNLKWALVMVSVIPIIICVKVCSDVQKMYRNVAIAKLYELYGALGQICSDDVLKEFFTNKIDSKNFLEKLAFRKEYMEQVIEEATKERVQSEQLKLELITNVSHDLKTPLTAIFSYLELMQREDSLDNIKSYTEDTILLCDNLRNMIERLFELSKVSSGAAEINLQIMEMNCLIQQVYSDMGEVIAESPAEFRMQLENEKIHFFGDTNYVYSICQNLFENAVKYSLGGTRIYVRTRKMDDAKIQLEVSNIATYEMDFKAEQIMERFVRGDKARTTKGNGLGLAIVKAYTEQCGGEFQIIIDGDQFKALVTFPQVMDIAEKR